MTPEFVTDSAGMRFSTIMLEDRQGFVRSLRPDRRVVRFELDIFGHPLRIGISFADRPAGSILCLKVPGRAGAAAPIAAGE